MCSRTARAVDQNQATMVAGLRRLGWGVWDTHALGRGAPDLVVCSPDGRLALGEVKSPGGRLTPRERYWHSVWPGTVHVWDSLSDVLATFGLTVEN